jgi:hypothetical protein
MINPSLITSSTIPLPASPQPSPAQSSDDSTDLYFRAYANHRPEMGESNTESALRQERINEDFKNMRDKQRKNRDKGLTVPNTPTNTKEELTNNVQEITLQTDYNLYPN